MPELRQCAWCLLVVDGTGRYSLQPGRKIKTATHGICPACKEQLRAEIDGETLLAPLAA
jgi:hypothetical protein